MKNVELPEFIDFLKSCSEDDFRGTAVDDYLKANRPGLDTFLPFIFFREDTYGRNLVYKTDLFEMLLLTWLPKQRTPIHDHAGQRCWMLLQSGRLCFRNYEPLDNDQKELICRGPAVTHEEGQAVYIDDGIGIHSIANPGAKPAISVHLYAAPISRCRIYDETTKTFDWVDLSYFTQFGEVASTSHPELADSTAHSD